MSLIVCVHQIEHLPHISLLKKISKVDVAVLGDTFQYKKNYYENRNKIISNNKEGWQWITIPVEKNNHKPMKDIKIIDELNWKRKYLTAIRLAYSKTSNFNKYFYKIENIINQDYKYLVTYNDYLLEFLLKEFNINTLTCLSSDLNLNKNLKGTDLLVEICKKFKADTYLSGASGKEYLELEKFGDIKVIFHEKEEGLSAIDHLFRFGGNLC